LAPAVRVLCLALGSQLAAPASVLAEDIAATGALAVRGPALTTSGSLKSVLASTPSVATSWAPSLVQAIRAYEAAQQAQEQLKQLRLQTDATRTELTSATGTLELLGRQRQEFEAQAQKLEAERQQRLTALRSELEAKLQTELSQGRQQIDEELKQEHARLMASFDARLGGLIDQHLEQQLEFQQRDIDQLSNELQTLSQEMGNRLGRLQAGSNVAVSMEQAIGRAVAEKKAEIQARHAQIKAQREQLVAKRRQEYAEKLRQQHAVEHQTRLLYKEASLRQAMAELLHGAQNQEDGALRQARQALEDLKPRQMQAAKRHSLLTTRLESLTQQYTGATEQIQVQEAARGESLARFEQTFARANASAQPEGLAWFVQVIQESPPPLASELSVIYHRLNARLQQERQLREQQRLLRERQLALQVSREMERRYQEEQDRQLKEQQAKAKKGDELLIRVKELQGAGRYDDALQLVTQVQMLNPAVGSQVALIQQDLEAAKEQATRQAKAATVERVFSDAMKAFEQGNFEQAVELFEHVIDQEAEITRPAP
jgi:hypothetical protein